MRRERRAWNRCEAQKALLVRALGSHRWWSHRWWIRELETDPLAVRGASEAAVPGFGTLQSENPTPCSSKKQHYS